MEIRTLVASLHTATTAAGNGNSASNPTGGGLIAGTLTGSGYVTAVCVLEASVAGSVWIPLAEPVEFRGHGVVEVEHYYSATAPLIRLRVVSITGTLAVGVYSVEDGPEDPLTQTPSGAYSLDGPLVAPNVAPRLSMATWTPFPVGNVSASTNTGSVGQLVLRAPCEFSRVRIWAGNNSGAPVAAITKILAAVSANLTTWSPSVGGALTEDQTTGWITADADGITVPAAAASIGGQEVPAYASSAIFSIKSIPADDGGRPWLFFRHPWAATNIGYRWIESSNHAFNPDDDAGAWMRYRRVANADYSYCGASAEAGGAAFTASTDLGLCPIFRVDFWADDAGWTSVDMIGGSTMAISTNNSETYALSWARLANKTLLDHRINLATYGVPGANTAHYYEMALISIANSQSKHIFFAVYSGNDGSWTQAAVDAMLRRFFTIKAIAADAGKVVIPVIMLHDSVGTSSTNRAIRIAANAKLRASGDVLDFGEVVGDPLNRDKFAAGMSTDGVHFSDAARLAIIAWAPAKIAEIVRRNPAWAA